MKIVIIVVQVFTLHQPFALKLVCQKCLNVTLTVDLCDLILKFYHKIEFYDDTCVQIMYD